MVISCLDSVSIIALIEAVALASAACRRVRRLVTGSEVRACSSRLPISARISAGSASRPVM
jgi:hypothetical protein